MDNIRTHEGKIRGYFGSDCDIVESVKSITKYAVELTEPSNILRVLQECYHNLTTGRPGPVWLSIPVDIQSMQVPETLTNYTVPNNISCTSFSKEFETVWKRSTRPIVLVGNGIHLSRTKDKFLDFVHTHDVPYVVSYFGSDLGDAYIGKVGIIGNRSGNFAIQNADLILCLGCRLSKSVTGYNRKLFGREAKIVYVDIDESEFMDEKEIDFKIHMDLKTFFLNELPKTNMNPKWKTKTKEWKDMWSVELPVKTKPFICPYAHLNEFFKYKPGDSIVTASSGSIYCVAWHMFRYKDGDRFITSSHGDMGYELPVAIGASFHGKRAFCILGDGSFQFNVQELQTLKHNNLPVTILVFNNGGYGAIKITQSTVFKREYGTSSESDITFCNVEKISKAYDIPFYRVNGDDDVGYLDVKSGPVIVEIVCNEQERFPKVTNKPMTDGTFKNVPHEDMAPFLDDETLEENMFIQRI
tara:strand:+ start:128 stop:1537 length:1410 start_codon:yes stop_codon:yes gene_type:complete